MPTIREAFELAQDFARKGENHQAFDICGQILQVHPQHRGAHFLLGQIHLREQRYEEAALVFSQLIHFAPDAAHAFNNLAIAYASLGQPSVALQHFERAHQLAPTHQQIRVNYAHALNAVGNHRQAIELLSKVDEAFTKEHGDSKDTVGIATELGHAYAECGDLVQAIACYEKVLAHEPDDAMVHWNLATAYLATGDYERGWREFSWRWRCSAYSTFMPRFNCPVWQGEDLDGKTLLVWTEQGLGDTFQFIRYVNLFDQARMQIIVRCARMLSGLLGSCPFIRHLAFDDENEPAADYHCSVLDLPRLFGTTLDKIPVPVPYLYASESRVAHWQSRLAESAGTTIQVSDSSSDPSSRGAALASDRPPFRVGIVWQGSRRYPKDATRSFPLVAAEPIARVPGVQLISLQRGFGMEQLIALKHRFPILDLGDFDSEGTGSAFTDTAAILKCLDMLVTCDSAVGHLAGAMGVPVWIALSANADWRWMQGRLDTPWYPRTELFRQSELNDWATVFQSMADRLRSIIVQSLIG